MIFNLNLKCFLDLHFPPEDDVKFVSCISFFNDEFILFNKHDFDDFQDLWKGLLPMLFD